MARMANADGAQGERPMARQAMSCLFGCPTTTLGQTRREPDLRQTTIGM